MKKNMVPDILLQLTYGVMNRPSVYMKAGFIETDVVDEDGIHEVNMFIEL